MPIKALINGVDVSAYLKQIDVEPGGDGLVGQGRLYLDELAGGLDIRTIHDVRVWVTFNAAGAGIAPAGRLFGGHVNNRDTGNVGTTKIWALNCWDYNIILDRTVRDAAPAKSIVLTAGTFAAQITQLAQSIQRNGGGAVNTEIDSTTGVANLYATMPAVTYEGGHKWGWYIQQLCNTAQALSPTLIPHFYMGVGAGFGSTESFGTPVLYVYNGAALPAIGVSFSDVVAGGRKGIFGTFRRVTDATTTIQRRQVFLGDDHTVVTSLNSASQVLYPWPYINHGGAANTGYIMDEVGEDNDSATFAQAQVALDRRNAAESVPVDSFEFETEERVQPGDMIGLGWALEGIADDTPYRVVKVQTVVEAPEVIVSKLTVNSRRLGLFDDGQAVFAPPVEGDPVPPLPPAAFTLTSNVYDSSTGRSVMVFAITASPSPDAIGYKIVGFVGHENADIDVGTNMAPELEFRSGLSYSFQGVAYDRTGNQSAPEPASPLTGVTAVPVYETLINADYESPDRLDATLPYHHTRTVANGGTAVRSTTNPKNGAAHLRLTTTATGGSTAKMAFPMRVMKGFNAEGLSAWIMASAACNVDLIYSWYDAAQVFISSTTVTKAVTTSYARYTGSVTPPSTARFYTLAPSLSALSKTVDVDTVSSEPQTPNDGIEVITDPSKVALQTDATFARFLYDINGVIRGKEYTTPTVMHYDGVNTGGAAPVSVTFRSTTGDNLFLSALGSDSGINSTAGANLSAAAGFVASLSGDGGTTQIQAGTGGLNTITGALSIIGALAVSGALTLSGMVVKTATFTADASNTIYVCNSASAITANLPATSGLIGRRYTFININTGKVTIDGNGSETINGITTYPLQGGRNSVTMLSTGAGWYVESQDGLILQSDGTRWLGEEITIPLVNYQGTQAYSANTEAYACAAFSDNAVLITRMELAYHVFTTNGASNYWTATFRRLTSGVSYSDVAAIDTSGGTNDTWTKPTADTSFSNNPTATNDIFWQVYLSKTGSPGNAFLIPTVKGRQVYT